MVALKAAGGNRRGVECGLKRDLKGTRLLLSACFSLCLAAVGTAVSGSTEVKGTAPAASSPTAPASSASSLSHQALEAGNPGLSATDPRQLGWEIFAEKDRRDSGFGDYQASLEMILYTPRGKPVRRTLQLRQIEQSDDGDRLLLSFNSPKTIKGTGLLSYSHRNSIDDQWLYLPAIKRVKKIAARDKSGPFLSSEFSFEDLSVQELADYDYRFLAEETVAGYPSFKVERIPHDSYSGYSRQVVWLDKQEYRIHRIDYYDRKGKLEKTLKSDEFERFGGRFWKPHRMVMHDHRRDRTTELLWTDFRFGVGLLADRDFTTNSLKRVF